MTGPLQTGRNPADRYCADLRCVWSLPEGPAGRDTVVRTGRLKKCKWKMVKVKRGKRRSMCRPANSGPLPVHAGISFSNLPHSAPVPLPRRHAPSDETRQGPTHSLRTGVFMDPTEVRAQSRCRATLSRDRPLQHISGISVILSVCGGDICAEGQTPCESRHRP